MPFAPKRSILSGVRVKTAMRRQVVAARLNSPLAACINQMVKHKVDAVLILDELNRPAGDGVISKSDLVLAYKHGRPISTPAGDIMQHPVWSCAADSILAKALQVMLIRDIQQIFVYPQDPGNIVGVLSLPDSAHFRSNSCRACIPGRMMADD